MSSVEERVKKIVVEQLGVKEEEVTTEASFVDDLGADSLHYSADAYLLAQTLKKTRDRLRLL